MHSTELTAERPPHWRLDAPARPPSETLAEDNWYGPVKAVADFAMALVLLVLSAPVILLAGLLIKLTSRGPVFYTQVRLGRHSRLFTIVKLRTMYHNCENHTGPQWSMPGDSRITWIGGILRRTHIDELPQLWNVLRGHMSMVGPRPERPEFVPKLETAIPFYRERLLVRPGITGLAQVQLPPDTDLTSVRRKLAHDIYYMRKKNLWLDARIIVATALNVLCVPEAVGRFILNLPGGKHIEQVYEQEAAFSHLRAEPDLTPA